MGNRPLTLIAVLLAVAAACHAQMEHEGSSKLACDAVLAHPLAPPPTLNPAFKPDCDSTAFYFGIGRPRDYIAARECAYAERASPDSNTSSIFYGPGVLSMIYANGEGSKRDVPLARRFACEAWSAPAELELRLQLLDQIAASAKPPHFDLCDTSTSGLSEGWCASIDSRLREVKRMGTLRIFSDMLPPDALPAFRALQAAEDNFDNLRSSNEVDLSGTGRAAFELEEQDKLRDQFLINLKRLSAPAFASPVPLATADRELDAAYKALKESMPSDATTGASYNPFGTITFDGVQKTQRAWVTLRDAWVAFAKASKSVATDQQVAAVITVQRAHQLKSLGR